MLFRSYYGRYTHFSWSDWIEREDLRETYYARHAALSDGQDHACFGSDIEDPPEWKRVTKKAAKLRKKKVAKGLPLYTNPITSGYCKDGVGCS